MKFILIIILSFGSLFSQVTEIVKYDYWNMVYSYDDATGFDFVDVAFKDSLNGVVVNYRLNNQSLTPKGFRVEKTKDGGDSWSLIFKDTSNTGTSYSIDYKDNIILILNEKIYPEGTPENKRDSSIVYMSNNDGLTWTSKKINASTKSSFINSFPKIKSVNDTIYFLSFRNNLFLTKDAGENWVNLYSKNIHKTLFDTEYNNGKLYLFTNNVGSEVLISDDLGQSFTELNNDSSFVGKAIFQLSVSDSSNIYASVGEVIDSTKLLFKLLKSEDHLKTWKEINTDPKMKSFKLFSNKNYLFAGRNQDNMFLYDKKENIENLSQSKYFDSLVCILQKAEIINKNLIYVAVGYTPSVWKFKRTETSVSIVNSIESSIYPNPVISNDEFFINLKNNSFRDMKVIIHTILGKKIFEKDVNNIVSKNLILKLNIKDYKKGIYLVTLTNKGKAIKTHKLIVK